MRLVVSSVCCVFTYCVGAAMFLVVAQADGGEVRTDAGMD